MSRVLPLSLLAFAEAEDTEAPANMLAAFFSRSGESGTPRAVMTGTGEWLEGIRFSSSASEETVLDWLNGLGL